MMPNALQSDQMKRLRPEKLKLDSSKGSQNPSLSTFNTSASAFNSNVRSTILISKSIEAQQRQIVASRSATITRNPDSIVNENEDDDIENEESENAGHGEQQIENGDIGEQDSSSEAVNNSLKEQTEVSGDNSLPETSITNNDDTLPFSGANSNKRFKRDRIPPPLNLSSADKAPRPIIKSAPIYHLNNPSYFTPAATKRGMFKHRRVGSSTNAFFPNLASASSSAKSSRQRLNFTPITPFDANLYQRRPVQMAVPVPYLYGTPMQLHPGAQGTPFMQPKTASGPVFVPQRNSPRPTHLERYQQQAAFQQQQWAKFQAFRESKKNANHVTDVFEGDTTRFAPPVAQPLSAQREFFDLDDIKPQVVKISKNFKNNQNENTDDANRIEGQDERNANEPKSEDLEDDGDDPENIAIEPDAEVGVRQRKNRLVKSEIRLDNNTFRFDFERVLTSSDNDKERFLNHCATAWDQFNKLI